MFEGLKHGLGQRFRRFVESSAEAMMVDHLQTVSSLHISDSNGLVITRASDTAAIGRIHH